MIMILKGCLRLVLVVCTQFTLLVSMEEKQVTGTLIRFSTIFKIIDQSPSRRTDYERLSVIYPLQFCSHRWAENKIGAERAIEVWENTVKTVNHWMQLPKSSQPKEDNKSYQRFKSSINNPLVPIKLKFFVRIADELNKFLVLYQREKPMVPFEEERKSLFFKGCAV